MHRGIAGAAILFLIPLLTASAPALAEPPFGPGGPGGPGCRMEHFLERQAEELGLDDATRDAIQKIVEDGREQAHELADALHEARSVMRDLLTQDVPDSAAVMRQAEIIGEIEIEHSKHRLAKLIQIRSLLTPEQRALLMQKREGRREAIVEACAADLETLCPEAGEGRGVFRCLRSHRDDLSEECREAMPRRKPGGRGGFGGPGRGFGSGPPCDH